MTNDEIKIAKQDGIDFIIVIELVLDAIRFALLYTEGENKDMLENNKNKVL
jgi:hypothetical protein